MAFNILILCALLLFTGGLVALLTWRTVKVLNPLDHLLREPLYSWDGWNNVRKLSGVWEGEKIVFAKRYSNPATFAVSLYRNISLPNIEVRSGRDGQLVFRQVEDVFLLFRKMNYSLTERDIKASSSNSQNNHVNVMRFFNSTRLQVARELLSSCKLDLIRIDSHGLTVLSENYKIWNSIASKEVVLKILPLLLRFVNAND